MAGKHGGIYGRLESKRKHHACQLERTAAVAIIRVMYGGMGGTAKRVSSRLGDSGA
jgi:hypothetical protein